MVWMQVSSSAEVLVADSPLVDEGTAPGCRHVLPTPASFPGRRAPMRRTGLVVPLPEGTLRAVLRYDPPTRASNTVVIISSFAAILAGRPAMNRPFTGRLDRPGQRQPFASDQVLAEAVRLGFRRKRRAAPASSPASPVTRLVRPLLRSA